jgi:nucleoid-associated protein YgaU
MGGLSKLLILAYDKKNYQDPDLKEAIDRFVLPINPTEYSQKFSPKYENEQGIGSQGNNPRFKKTIPEQLDLEFVLDGTGVVPIKEQAGSFHRNVKEQVEKFLKVTYYMNTKTHRPNFLRLIWGEQKFGYKYGFDCLLQDAQINYTLFSPEGMPLRAKVKASFVSYIEPDLRIREEGKQSPDITHLRRIKEGDRLDLMASEIYGDSAYYLQVAKANGLSNLRRLRPNTELRFPPLDKISP